MKPFVLHADAEVELREALDFYEGRRINLGGAFRQEFEAALQRVRENPQAYAADDDAGVRSCPLRRFPYALIYVELDDRIWVAAVARRVSLLFDQNLSRKLPALLAAEFPGSDQVFLAGLAGANDRAVWAYAAARRLAVVSKARTSKDNRFFLFLGTALRHSRLYLFRPW